MNKLETTQLSKIISNASLDELRLIANLISDRKDTLAFENKYTLKVGQQVYVNHPKLKGVTCTIKEIKRTKASIRCDRGAYTVPLSLIEQL
jgi:hypothetical protein